MLDRLDFTHSQSASKEISVRVSNWEPSNSEMLLEAQKVSLI